MDKPYRPEIRTQEDLETFWRTLMEPLGFARHVVWMVMIGSDDRPTPVLTEIEDGGTMPTEAEQAGLAEVLRTVIADDDPGGRWAFLRARPGHGATTDDDRAWARMLLNAARVAGVPVEVVHLATDTHLVPIPMDDISTLAS